MEITNASGINLYRSASTVAPISHLTVTDSTGFTLLDVPRDSWMIAGHPPIRVLLRQALSRLRGK